MILDFAALLVFLTVASGLIWAVDSAVFAPRRRAVRSGEAAGDGEFASAEEPPLPVLVDYSKSLFPVFLVVLLLRSFVVEPFRIPSASMMPTLLIGDFILVNKFSYGLRLPVLNYEFVDLGAPERGDVVVFRYPDDPATPFIKRIVGVPGDEILYRDKVLYVNGEVVPVRRVGTYFGVGAGADHTGMELLLEELPGRPHEVLHRPRSPSRTVAVTVPQGEYFVLGDNRDNSKDSRFWGTVPDDLLIGRAFVIWMNWDARNGGVDWGRLGNGID